MKTIPAYTFSAIGKEEKAVDIFPWGKTAFYDFDMAHSHTYHEILIFSKGEGIHQIDNLFYTVKDKSVHIVPQNYVHCLERQAGIEGFTIVVSQTFVEQLCHFDPATNYRSFWDYPSVINFSDADYSAAEFYFREIRRRDINDSYRQNICVSILLNLIPFVGAIPRKEESFASTVKKLVQANYTQRLSTARYADLMCMSAITLNAKLRRSTGKTIMQMQDDMLLSGIKRYIFSTDNSLKEIAWEHGFEDYAHFSHFFKKHTGMSPQQFREEIKKHKK